MLSLLLAVSITLGWNPNAASENITSYRVHMGLTPGLYDWHWEDITEVTYRIDGLTFGTTYYFAVTALNAAGESGYSSELSYTPMPTPTAPGTGLRGQYYNDNPNGAYPLSNPFAGSPVLTRTDATVDFDWGGGSPASQVNSNFFSSRWTGQVKAPVSGSYTFTVTGDDGVRLFLNGQLVIDGWTDQYPTSYSYTTTLTAGTLYNIELHYYEYGGDASCRLRWSYPGQSTQTIPSSQLYPLAGP
jgi:PA14 domain/Fibronectin type III domain